MRAEPVAALYEQRKIFHVGSFPVLEDQQTSFTTDFDRQAAGYSPDRVDSLVWAMTELLVTPMPSYAAYELAREQAEFGMSNGPERPVTLRVFGCLSHCARGCTEAGVRKASKEETAGEYAPAAVSVYGDFRRGSARLGRSRTELPA